MINEIIKSYSLCLDKVRSLVSDLDEKQMTARPSGINHPAWTLGHLVYGCQMIGGEMGMPPWLSKDWCKPYLQGSKLDDKPEDWPTKEELLTALADGQQRVIARLSELTAEDLAGPIPDEGFRKTFPSLGHALMYILIGHTSIHCGQMMTWRRVMGL